MASLMERTLVKPHCRFCGREWLPREHVSARLAFCDVCEPERLALATANSAGVGSMRGLDGKLVLLPADRVKTSR